jgi:hypothetical protein
MKKPLNRNLRIRLNEDEDKALADLALILGEWTRSGVVRKMIREAIGQGPDLSKDNLESFREGVRQLGAVGRNINQIAHAIHAGKAGDCPWDSGLLNAIAQQVLALGNKLADIVMRCRNRWVRKPDGVVNHG